MSEISSAYKGKTYILDYLINKSSIKDDYRTQAVRGVFIHFIDKFITHEACLNICRGYEISDRITEELNSILSCNQSLTC